ncbi:MAG: hypothetical protein ABII00_13135 [Elusimicrobiota bacterium]
MGDNLTRRTENEPVKAGVKDMTVKRAGAGTTPAGTRTNAPAKAGGTDKPGNPGKGGKAMKKTWAAIALMGLMLGYAGNVWADANLTNDTDQVIITITPNIDRGVEIDTATVVLNLGSLDLYASTQTVSPATVTILGTLSGQELDLTGAITSGGTPWTFDASPTTDQTSGETDKLAAYVLFGDTPWTSAAPGAADFADVTAAASYISGTQRAGSNSGDGTKYEWQTDTVDMDNKAPNDQVHMWLFFRLPNWTSTASDQNVTFTLTAADAS